MTSTFDLIATVLLTASAATLIAILAGVLGDTALARVRIAGWLGAWFAFVVASAAIKLFYFDRGPLAAAGLGLAVVAPVIVLIWTVARTPALRSRLAEVPLSLLIGLHAVRVLGILFIVLYASGRLPAPFAPTAGVGDIFIGVTALPLAAMVARGGPGARTLAWIWNAIGIADLISAIALGVTSSPGPIQVFGLDTSSAIMTTVPWLLIPAFLVPLLFALHIAIALRLAAAEGSVAGRPPAIA